MVDDALHADEADASDAEVPHQLLRVHAAEVAIPHHFLVLVRVLKRQVVLGEFLSLEGLLEGRFAEGAEREALLLNLDQAHLAEGVATV